MIATRIWEFFQSDAAGTGGSHAHLGDWGKR
jgi:hypothetical protein